MTKEYMRTLADIDIILENVSTEERDKIPKKLVKLIHENKLKDYKSNISVDIPLEQQQLHEDTAAFLAMLYLNYWCESQEEKESFKRKLANNEEKYQMELREKYNTDNIFKNKVPTTNNEEEKNIKMVSYKKKSWVRMVFDRIINIFRRKENEKN